MRRKSSAVVVLAIAVAAVLWGVSLWAEEPYVPYNAEAAKLKNPLASSRAAHRSSAASTAIPRAPARS